jgi:PAS domain S-box-containing protein
LESGRGLPGLRRRSDGEDVNNSPERQTSGDRTPIPPGALPLEEILCTEKLRNRKPRQPDYAKENSALVALARALADSPGTILQVLADTILAVCQSESAGISLLTREDGGKRFYWPAISGLWKPHIGGGTPRDFGPCGDVLDRNTPLLFTHVERRYTYFQPVEPPVEEALLVPFYVRGKAVGTIWAVAHTDDRKFDAEDERLMRSLGTFASSAYQVLESRDAITESQDGLSHALAEANAATAKFRAVFEQTAVFAGVMTADGIILDANRLFLEVCGYRAEDVLGRLFWECGWWQGCPESQAKIQAATPLAAQGKSYREMLPYRWADGSERVVDFALDPIRDQSGQIIFLHPTGVDVTDLKNAQEKYRRFAETLEEQVRVRTQEVEQQSKQLRALSRRLLKTQDDERRRLARELHDSAGQDLAAIQMNLNALLRDAGALSPAQQEHISNSINVVARCDCEIRTMSYLLHPPLLDELGLRSALSWYLDGFSERSGIKVDLQMPEDLPRMEENTETAIFRVVQQSLVNIHRHSGSYVARVSVECDAERINLQICDEGKGMSAEALAGINSGAGVVGVGMSGMRERVRGLEASSRCDRATKERR